MRLLAEGEDPLCRWRTAKACAARGPAKAEQQSRSTWKPAPDPWRRGFKQDRAGWPPADAAPPLGFRSAPLPLPKRRNGGGLGAGNHRRNADTGHRCGRSGSGTCSSLSARETGAVRSRIVCDSACATTPGCCRPRWPTVRRNRATGGCWSMRASRRKRDPAGLRNGMACQRAVGRGCSGRAGPGDQPHAGRNVQTFRSYMAASGTIGSMRRRARHLRFAQQEPRHGATDDGELAPEAAEDLGRSRLGGSARSVTSHGRCRRDCRLLRFLSVPPIPPDPLLTLPNPSRHGSGVLPHPR